MTATERLRALLMERGVPWKDYGYENHTWWGEWHAENRASVNGLFLKVEGVVTPEQAIAATLGAGTCHLVKERVGKSGKAYRMVCSECHHVIYDGWQEKPRYCAFCGARVEDE